MKIEDMMAKARMHALHGRTGECLTYARLLLQQDESCVQALRFIGEFGSSRSERITALAKAKSWAERLLQEGCKRLDGYDVEDEHVTATLTLGDELAAGSRVDVLAAIEMAETIGRSEDHAYYAAPRIVRWCAQQGLWGRGMPWACMLAFRDELEGRLWAALYLGPSEAARAEELLTAVLAENRHIARLIESPKAPSESVTEYEPGSLAEAQMAVKPLHATWWANFARIEDGWINALMESAPA